MRTVIDAEDLATFITNHKDTLIDVQFSKVNLYGGASLYPGKTAEGDYTKRTPWSTVFTALKSMTSPCGIRVESATQYKRTVKFLELWHVADHTPLKRFWSTTVQVVPSDDTPSLWEYSMPELNTWGGRERFMNSTVFDIDISRDDNWAKGLERVDQMYRYYLEAPHERGVPPWLVDGKDPADAYREIAYPNSDEDDDYPHYEDYADYSDYDEDDDRRAYEEELDRRIMEVLP